MRYLLRMPLSPWFLTLAVAMPTLAQETDEADPIWTPLTEIPYDEMWEDDVIWLPRMLEGKPFSGRYLFDEDKMLDHALDLDPGKARQLHAERPDHRERPE